MPDLSTITQPKRNRLPGAIFITFTGNCKQALSYYQTCFGGQLQFETFEGALTGYPVLPLISGSLVADRIIIYGSDLVHNEGRKVGNHMAVFLPCKNKHDRKELITKLEFKERNAVENDQKLIEITDAFDVRWILGI